MLLVVLSLRSFQVLGLLYLHLQVACLCLSFLSDPSSSVVNAEAAGIDAGATDNLRRALLLR
ncbi:hypothetical protein Patl1_27706 [Pistacia atlantica]|uniref:Uncharacterized protein n=1 Tax=Pistacia atlantica TaxID=434234 RepID=A0ACC1BH44_9ROSI|nr:hypothetical protein Patl1_27706 [Pistacia atlantica]